MNQDIHEHARELIALEAAGQQDWLRSHLQECAACRDYAEAAGEAVQAVRSQPFAAGSALVRATQMRVRARAVEQQQQRESAWLVCVACLFVGLSAAFTTPVLWRIFEWLGARAGVSNWIWQVGFVYFGIVPALVVSAVFLARGTHLANDGQKQWK